MGSNRTWSTASTTWRSAARQGDADAMYFLARLYEGGELLQQDTQEALWLYWMAAIHGHNEGQERGRELEQRATPAERAAVEERKPPWPSPSERRDLGRE